MAGPSKEWAGLSSRLQDFCAASKELTGSHNPEHTQLQQLYQSAQELVTEARAVVNAFHSCCRPDLADSLTGDAQVLGALAAAAVAALQLPQPQFVAPAYAWLDAIARILDRVMYFDQLLQDVRAVKAAAAVQLTRSGLIAMLPDLVITVASQLGPRVESLGAASGSSSSSSGARSNISSSAGSTSSTSHIDNRFVGSSGNSVPHSIECSYAAVSGPDDDDALLLQQATILLGVLCASCHIWPRSTGGSAAVKERDGLSAKLAIAAMQHVDRALQQLPAGAAPGVCLATLAVAASSMICSSLYLAPASQHHLQQVKDYVAPGGTAAHVHRQHMLAALCCRHLTQLLWQHGLQVSASPSSGTTASASPRTSSPRTSTSSSNSSPDISSCLSNSPSAGPSRTVQLLQDINGYGSSVLMDAAATWQLVPQYRGLLRRLLPDDQQSTQLLQAATGLSSTTLLWCSILICTSQPSKASGHWNTAAGLDISMAAALDAMHQNVGLFRQQDLVVCAQQAYLAVCMLLRWLAGLQWQELVSVAYALDTVACAPQCCESALVLLNTICPASSGPLARRKNRAVQCTFLSCLNVTPATMLEQLPPLGLRSTQQALQCCLELAGSSSTNGGSGSVPLSGTKGGSSSSSGVAADLHDDCHNPQPGTTQQSSGDRYASSDEMLQIASNFLLSTIAKLSQLSGRTEAAFAVWQPYAAHFTSLLEAYVRSDAVGPTNIRAHKMQAVQPHLTAVYVSTGGHPDARALRGDLAVRPGPLLAHATAPGVVPGSAAQMQLYSLLCSSLKLVAAAATDVDARSACLIDVSTAADYMLHHLACGHQWSVSDVTSTTQSHSAGHQVPAGQGSSQAAAATLNTIVVETLLPWMRLLGSCLDQYAVVLQDWMEQSARMLEQSQRTGSRISISNSDSIAVWDKLVCCTNATITLQDILQHVQQHRTQQQPGRRQQPRRQQQQGRQRQAVRAAALGGQRHNVAHSFASSPGANMASSSMSHSAGTSSMQAAARRLSDWLSAYGYDVSNAQQQVHDVRVQLEGIIKSYAAAMPAAAASLLLDYQRYASAVPAAAAQRMQRQSARSRLSMSKLGVLHVSKLSAAADSLASIAIPQVCNNPRCSNMDGHSEIQLVSGSSCICGGCSTAAYCGRACQVQHRPQHKAVCRALAQARVAMGAKRAAAGDGSDSALDV